MEPKDYAAQFWRDGYLVIDDFFTQSLMDGYQTKIIDHFGLAPQFSHNDEFIHKSQTEIVPWFPQREGERCFDQLSDHTELSALTEAILGPDWYEQYCMVMFSSQGTKGQAWHQDCAPKNQRKFNLNRLIYTMDIDAAKTGGQVMVMPGSHKQGILPSEGDEFDTTKAVVLNPKRGTLVLLHGFCYHKVTPVTGLYRVSTNFRVAPKGTPEDITDIAVYRNMLYQFSTSTVLEQRC